jgi:ribose transport system permease protein
MSTTDPATAAAGGTGGGTTTTTGTDPGGGRTKDKRVPRPGVGPFLQRFGVLIAFVLVFAWFSIAREHAFLSLENLHAVLSGAAALSVLAAALTVPMIMHDFDLSIGYHTQLLAVVVVTLMAFDHWSSGLAIAATVVLGATIGASMGWVIARSRVSAFVFTLGAGLVFQGVEEDIGHDATIFQGIPPSFAHLATDKLLGFTLPVWIALFVTVGLWYMTRHTVLGRRMAAVGGNQEAARLSGVNVELVRTLGFVVVGVAAAIAAVIITSQSDSYYTSSASGLLIPAFAGVFLGATVLRPGEFHVWGTLIGVLFFQMIQNGLTLLNYSSAASNIVQGGVFIVAVLMSRIGSGRR